jgi:hypothetical protein
VEEARATTKRAKDTKVTKIFVTALQSRRELAVLVLSRT